MPRTPRALLALGLVAVAAPLLAAAPAQAADPASATLTVVHGVRGLVADVRLDDQLVLSGFAPERVTDPLSLAPGPHHVQAWPTGAATSTAPVLDTTITLTAGQRATAGIGLGPAGTPVLTVYDDAALLRDAGSTALAVRNLALSDPVQVTAGSTTVSASLAPAGQAVADVPAGTYPVQALPVAGGSPLVPPQDVPVVAGRAVVLYLIGSQSDATLGWVAQTVSADVAPTRVDTGVGPLPVDGPALPAVPAGAVLALLLVAGPVAVRRSRAA